MNRMALPVRSYDNDVSALGDRLGVIGIVLVLAIMDDDAQLRAVALRELDRAASDA